MSFGTMTRTDKAGRPGIVSFFSGCGILDLGFEAAGFSTHLANEINGPFADAYEFARHGRAGISPEEGGVVRASIETFFSGEQHDRLRRAMDLARAQSGIVGFVGGPPCPDFSIAGKQAGHTGDRGRLTQDYFDLIGIHRPDFFLFENVRGLRSTAKHRAYFDTILNRAVGTDGYAVTERLVNSLEYAAPQDRHRVIVIGFHRDAFPDADGMARAFGWEDHATFSGAYRQSWPGKDTLARCAEDGEIEDAGRPRPGTLDPRFMELAVQTWFDRNDVESHPNAQDRFLVKAGMARMRQIAEGDTSRKSFKRLHRWRYAPTMAFGNNEVPLHPYKDRRISVAEALALQSLPKEFVLPPTRSETGGTTMTLTDKFKTIGNGVPFLLAKALALTVREAIGDRRALPVRLDPLRGRTPLVVPKVEEAVRSTEQDAFAFDEEAAAQGDAVVPAGDPVSEHPVPLAA